MLKSASMIKMSFIKYLGIWYMDCKEYLCLYFYTFIHRDITKTFMGHCVKFSMFKCVVLRLVL